MVSLRDKFNNFLIIAAGDTITPNSTLNTPLSTLHTEITCVRNMNKKKDYKLYNSQNFSNEQKNN